jgi:hypothetical protein
MKRRQVLRLAALGVVVAVAALGGQKPASDKLLLLEWAHKAPAEAPPTAVLIELGFKDVQPQSWSGTATVNGARVVHREGYRFRDGDKLLDPDAWQASSHRPLRAPPKMPAAITLEPHAGVGVVLHLADVRPDATLSLRIQEREIDEKIALKDVLAGKTHSLQNGRAVVRLISTAVPVETAKTEDDFPAACYGPDGTLWVAYVSYTVKDEGRRIEAAQLKEQPADFKAFYTPDFGDQLFVKSYRDGKWSKPVAVTGAKEDLVRCAIAAEGDGTVWVVYSANRDGKHKVYGRPITTRGDVHQAGEEILVSRKEVPALGPVACTDQKGRVHVAYQAASTSPESLLFGRGHAVIEGRRVTEEEFRQNRRVDYWSPAVAAGSDGQTATAFDYYFEGDYDVAIHSRDGAVSINSSRFEARPSLCYDTRGRLWIAYEEGPEQWGKNFGALDQQGNPLYFARTIKVVCLADGKLMAPVAELPPLGKRGDSPDAGQLVEALPRYAYPKIGLDGKGRLWLTYREKFGTRYTTHPGSYWLTKARRLDGDHWSEPIELHHSDGLLDSRPVLLPHPAGGLRIVHNTDGRFTTPDVIDNQIYMSYLDLPGDPVEPKLVSHESDKKDGNLVDRQKAEDEAVRRCREYRVEVGGKKYQLLRGEFHRHTEISWDGGPDGSLEDMWRYAIDVAAMDWIGNGDHDNGAGREYPWWLTQKTTDAYHIADRFTPMFTYERSVAYPHGHRNCMFARRGVRTLPRLAEPDMDKRVGGVHADDTKMLYRYLKELNGICASHTSATNMGTDWRDNDPAVEPIVEIYQGDRMSYEKELAPRAGFEPKSGKKPANIAGWFPLGFINNALDKGHRLAFQSSSDHFSTHISYCIVLAERHDRQAVLDGMKKRHCYGATDNIVLEVTSGAHTMGDEFRTDQPPTLQIKAIGTAALAKVEVLKDSTVVHTFEPGKAEFQGKWTDPKPTTGTHYYYVRVQQADGELAWGSPLWIELPAK